jgi:hypothetical protein
MSVARDGAMAMNILFVSDLLRMLDRERLAATPGRPFNAIRAIGTA